MDKEFSVYCDESCHLENDHHGTMILGAVMCSTGMRKEHFNRIREIKVQHGLDKFFEIKWNKVSLSKIEFYLDLIDYFFDNVDLTFRTIIINKDGLDHKRFKQTHDDFYYKMYFELLKVLLNPRHRYSIYVDIKDTQGAERVEKLHEVLANSKYDFKRKIIKKIEQVDSSQVELIQLADLLIGLVGYKNRGLGGNAGKTKLVHRVIKRSGYDLTRTNLLREEKFNIFKWVSSD